MVRNIRWSALASLYGLHGYGFGERSKRDDRFTNAIGRIFEFKLSVLTVAPDLEHTDDYTNTEN